MAERARGARKGRFAARSIRSLIALRTGFECPLFGRQQGSGAHGESVPATSFARLAPALFLAKNHAVRRRNIVSRCGFYLQSTGGMSMRPSMRLWLWIPVIILGAATLSGNAKAQNY